MNKDSIICWHCEKMTMEPAPELGSGWRKCSNCGATHQPHPSQVSQSTIVVEQVAPGTRETKYRPQKVRQPKTPAKA